MAVQERFLSIIQILIDNGADVNAKDREGFTPLHQAVEYGDEATTEMLIGRGADVNAKDNYGNTPLHQSSDLKIARILISKGASFIVKNENGETPLDCAVLEDDVKMAKLLLKSGAKINDNGTSDHKLLHSAS